jgi:hypothetical protein
MLEASPLLLHPLPSSQRVRRTKAAVSYPTIHGGLEALVAPDSRSQESRANKELQCSTREPSEELPNEPTTGQRCRQEAHRLIPSLFVFLKQSGYR